MSIESSTGTTLATYLEWLESEASSKAFGEVGIYLTIHGGQIVDVRKTSVDTEHFKLVSVLPEPRRSGGPLTKQRK